MSSPFGIAFYVPLTQLTVLQELGQGAYIVEAPTSHPLFQSYVVRATPALGVVWVKGLGPEIDNDNFGTTTRAAVDRLAEQLTHKYGQPKKSDFLMQGSIWSEAQDWMAALNNNERFYHYSWERPAASQLPDDLENIFVGATSLGGYSAQVVLEYSSRRLPEAEAELERRMADLL